MSQQFVYIGKYQYIDGYLSRKELVKQLYIINGYFCNTVLYKGSLEYPLYTSYIKHYHNGFHKIIKSLNGVFGKHTFKYISLSGREDYFIISPGWYTVAKLPVANSKFIRVKRI